MSLFEELIEDEEGNKKILKSFKTKKSLSDVIFEKSGKDFIMHSEIRKKLLDIANEFIDYLGIDFFIHDVHLTGSLANYNWSNFSDVDLHIIIDFKEADFNTILLKDFLDAKKNLWNEKHNILIKGFEVELYVQDTEEPHVSSGVFSVLNNKWLLCPVRNEVKIDDRMIIQKANEFESKIDNLVKKSDKTDILKQIEGLRIKLKKFRQSGLETGGEFSYENLTFKLLRRNGSIERLLKLKTQVQDKKLSITQ
jgi:predicted nucleotidyltransferase